MTELNFNEHILSKRTKLPSDFSGIIIRIIMKIKILSLAALVGITGLFVSQINQSNDNIKVSKYSPRVAENVEEAKSAQGAAEYLASIRGDYKTGIVDPLLVEKAQNYDKYNSSRASNLGLQFEFMGPGNMGGRTRGIVVDNEDPNKLYAASVTGGVFISTNGGNGWGRSWIDKSGNSIRTNNISCLTQTTDGKLYAGTGSRFEAGGQKGNNGGTPNGTGQGIYVSDDRGASWSVLINTTQAVAPGLFSAVNYIVAHPTDPNTIAAATDRGLQVTTDGGITWKINIACTAGNTPKAPCITADWSKDGSMLHAGFGDGQFHSGTEYTTDCGLKSLATVGLDRNRRWMLSSSPSDSMKIYALITNGGGFTDLKVSTDGGAKWEAFNPPMPVSADNFDLFGSNGGGQAWYDLLFMAVPNLDDPKTDKLFIGGVQLWRFDGNWTQAAVQASSGQAPGPYNMHVDHHTITYDKKNPEKIYFGNDGGVYKSQDGGYTFFDINKDYSTTQFYNIAHASFDYVVGGTQDNGNPYVTPMRPGNPTYGVTTFNQGVLNGDGFDAAVSQIVDLKYVSSQYGNMGRGKILSRQGSGACEPYCGMGTFYTNIRLWENDNDLTSKDSILFIVDTSEVNVGLGTGSRNTFEGTITPDQVAAQIIAGSIRIGTNINQLVYDGKGGFTGKGKGSLDEKTWKFSVTFDDPPALNARINTYFTSNYPAGSIITVPSASENLPIQHVINTNLSPGDILKIQDPIQSLIAMQVNQKCSLNASGTEFFCDNKYYGINNRPSPEGCGTPTPGRQQPGLVIARRGIALGANPDWMHFALGSVSEFEFSTNGNELFYNSGNTGIVNMLQGINDVYSQEDADKVRPVQIFSGAGNVTSINFNPKDQNQMLITTGNYGAVNHVYLVTRTPNTNNFSSKIVQGTGLPDMPVYDAIFDADQPKRVILATDQGIYSTNDVNAGSVEWTTENFSKIPVFDIDQQTLDHTKSSNYGMVYLGTHGAGIWKSSTIVGLDQISHKEFGSDFESSITVYPNPIQGAGHLKLTVANPDNAVLHIYSINGTLQKSIRPNLTEGENDVAFDVSELPSGSYFITLLDGGNQKVAKFVKMN